jgi:uncharacterized protein with PIN domain
MEKQIELSSLLAEDELKKKKIALFQKIEDASAKEEAKEKIKKEKIDAVKARIEELETFIRHLDPYGVTEKYAQSETMRCLDCKLLLDEEKTHECKDYDFLRNNYKNFTCLRCPSCGAEVEFYRITSRHPSLRKKRKK